MNNECRFFNIHNNFYKDAAKKHYPVIILAVAVAATLRRHQ